MIIDSVHAPPGAPRSDSESSKWMSGPQVCLFPEIDRGGVLASLYRSLGSALGNFFEQAPFDPWAGRIARSRRGEPIRVGIFLGSWANKNRPSAASMRFGAQAGGLVQETLTHLVSLRPVRRSRVCTPGTWRRRIVRSRREEALWGISVYWTLSLQFSTGQVY